MNYKEKRIMKRKITLLLFVLIGFAGMVSAQRGGGARKDKIEAMKIGFLTQRLNLTPEEAQKFWPVYNRFNDEMEKVRKGNRAKLMEEAGEMDNMSDVEAEKALNEMIANKAAELEIIKKYTAEFKKVLPAQKVVKLFVAEQAFKRELLKKLKEQRDN